MPLLKGKITLKEQLNMQFVFEHAQLAATNTDTSTPFTALIGCCFYICLSKTLSTPDAVYFRHQSCSFVCFYLIEKRLFCSPATFTYMC